jgi:hypothetical protein
MLTNVGHERNWKEKAKGAVFIIIHDLLTSKDLRKRVTIEAALPQSTLFERLRKKPFWIWNIQEHKQEDIWTNGGCCFNHIIGLPQINGNDKPTLWLWGNNIWLASYSWW